MKNSLSPDLKPQPKEDTIEQTLKPEPYIEPKRPSSHTDKKTKSGWWPWRK